jgi:hypothetical protein
VSENKCDKPRPGPGAPATLALTPLQLLDRLAALVPLPRIDRHRCFGVPAQTAGYRKFPQRPQTAEDGGSATFKSERERFDRRRSQNPKSTSRMLGSGHRDR